LLVYDDVRCVQAWVRELIPTEVFVPPLGSILDAGFQNQESFA